MEDKIRFQGCYFTMNFITRQMKPPGGECHDIFEQGTNFNGSSAPSNPHHRQANQKYYIRI